MWEREGERSRSEENGCDEKREGERRSREGRGDEKREKERYCEIDFRRSV